MSWTKWRRPWLIFHFIITTFGILSFDFYVPEQEEAKKRALMRLPCLPNYIYEADLYVFSEENTYHITLFSIFITWISTEIFIFAYSLVQKIRKQLKDRKMSPKTYQLQKKFFTALAIQMLLPLTLLIIPCIYTWCTVFFNFYKQAFTNIALVLGSMHGLLSTLVMLFIHHPYREAMKFMFFGQETNIKKIRKNTVISSVAMTAEK
uniref:Serpentine Receptor, class H n=1 Tax=Caenorhabditis tropicalis TaxID=1561998 RepID=A0A1I7TY06_9PELO